MTLGQFLLLYLIAGAAVAAAVYLTFAARGPAERAFQTATAVLCWPFYLTLLLARPESGSAALLLPDTALAPDALDWCLAQVDAELERALLGLDGWPDSTAARHRDQLRELRAAWAAQAACMRELDRLLGQLEWPAAEPLGEPTSERIQASRQALRENVRRLWQVRAQAHQDLLEALASVRELVSLLHLARFTGAPAARVDELIAEIAGAVHGLAPMTWRADMLDQPYRPIGVRD